MTCTNCSSAIEKHLATVVGVVSVSVSLITNKAVVEYRPREVSSRKLIEEIEDIGFGASLITGDGSLDVKQLAEKEVDKYFWNFLFCFLLYVPLGILIWLVPYVEPLHPFMTYGEFWRGNTVYVMLCLVFATIVQFVMGQPFYNGAYKSLKHGNANMDVLIVIGTTCAWLYGLILFVIGYPDIDTMEADHMVSGHAHEHDGHASHQDNDHHRLLSGTDEQLKHYRHEIHANVHNFETSAILILIVLLGKYIESYSKLKTLDKISILASLKVSKANLLTDQDAKKVNLNAAFSEIAVELLAIGDFIVVQPGGAVPTDG